MGMSTGKTLEVSVALLGPEKTYEALLVARITLC
jgi:hypothetical protein